LFVFNRAFLAAAGYAFRRSKTAGRFAVLQPSSLGNAVVEHKAQRHFEGLLLPSLFIARVYSAAHEVPERTIVPHIVIAMYIAV
jgi:hypothetical protein